MRLLKTVFLSGVITFIRIASGFVSSKVIAVYTGPAGVALFGQLSNFVNFIIPFSNGSTSSGIVKYTAEYQDDTDQVKSLFSTSLRISVYSSAIIGTLLLAAGQYISVLILKTSEYASVIHMFGCTLVLYSLNTLLISILNGKQELKMYTLVNTIGSVVGLLLTLGLVYYFKVAGALYALVLSQSVVFFITAALIYKRPWFSWSYFSGRMDPVQAKRLGSFALMALVATITQPVTQLVIRNFIIHDLSLTSAGLWQAMTRISDGYLMIVTISLSTYYMPKLSSLHDDVSLRKEVILGYKIIMPFVIFSCIVIYFFRFFLIEKLFTADFFAMENLFVYQLIGDIVKIAAWIIAYLMLAKAMIKTSIIIDIVFSVMYILLVYLLMPVYGLLGVTIAFFFNYLLYFITLVWLFRKLLFNRAP